jgi:hypothetical protein
MAPIKEEFDAWEGWVHSRMRLLVRSAGNMVDVRPWPKAFKPPQQDGANGAENGGQQPVHSCFYFMGLSKKKASGRGGGSSACLRVALRAGHLGSCVCGCRAVQAGCIRQQMGRCGGVCLAVPAG